MKTLLEDKDPNECKEKNEENDPNKNKNNYQIEN